MCYTGSTSNRGYMHKSAYSIQVTDQDFLTGNLLYKAVRVEGAYAAPLSGAHEYVEFRSPNYGVLVPKRVLVSFYHFYGCVRNQTHTVWNEAGKAFPRSPYSFIDEFGNTIMRLTVPLLLSQPHPVIFTGLAIDLNIVGG